MDVLTVSQHGRSLPAQFGAANGYERLMGGNNNIQSAALSLPVDIAEMGLAGIGDYWQQATDLLKAGSNIILPIIATNKAGTVLQQNPDGTLTVYRQPEGSQQNLPVMIQGGGGVQYPGSTAQLQTPWGTGGFQNVDMGNVALVALAGLAIFALMNTK